MIAEVETVSDQTGHSMAQVALAWLRWIIAGNSDPRGTYALAVARRLASFRLTLSLDQVKTLDEASHIELGFPYDLYTKEMPRAICYGGLRDQILA